MEIVHEPEALRAACESARARGDRVALVPTMGALHEGHLSLVTQARARAGFVVVSIFVNPTQFGPSEDLARYPRTLEADGAACEAAGVDVVFAPEVAHMYPPGDETRVTVGATARHLCGVHRPRHFEGVATVVAKLFALVGPSIAIFGRKDYQQWRVVQRMTTDLLLPIEIVAAPTVRERDGLALSSRNAYLSPAERARAASIPRALSTVSRAFAQGERKAARLREVVVAQLEADVIDYVELADPAAVEPLADEAEVPDRVLLAIAVRIGATRLIDNLVLGEDDSPELEGS